MSVVKGTVQGAEIKPVDTKPKKPPEKKNMCCVCRTTKNLHKDGWYGYRCNSDKCLVF